MNLIEKIQQEILFDDAETNKQSERLMEIYNNSKDQDEIDNIMICLCGYSMGTLEML